MTRYADKILNMINSSSDHLTAEQIFLRLKKTESKIVIASVYNNLNTLVKNGLVRKISLEGEADRYDKVKKHDHLVCKSCGRLADFEFEDITQSIKTQLHSDIFDYDLKVYYICPECRNKNKQ